MDIIVTLRPAELKALVRRADEERRSPTDQAAYLLARELMPRFQIEIKEEAWMRRFLVEMDEQTFRTLADLALAEKRSVKAQANWLLENAKKKAVENRD